MVKRMKDVYTEKAQFIGGILERPGYDPRTFARILNIDYREQEFGKGVLEFTVLPCGKDGVAIDREETHDYFKGDPNEIVPYCGDGSVLLMERDVQGRKIGILRVHPVPVEGAAAPPAEDKQELLLTVTVTLHDLSARYIREGARKQSMTIEEFIGREIFDLARSSCTPF